jgi:hypothetical protein
MMLLELLERAGSRKVTARRADCFGCGGYRTISHTDEVFFCHQCGVKGNLVTLAQSLGLEVAAPPAAELLAARRAAHRLAVEAEQRRRQAQEAHCTWLYVLDVVEEAARTLGLLPDDDGVWGMLAEGEAALREARAELTILDGGSAAELIDYLEGSAARRVAWHERLWLSNLLDYQFPGRSGSLTQAATPAVGAPPWLPSRSGGRGQAIAPAVAAIFERVARARGDLSDGTS